MWNSLKTKAFQVTPENAKCKAVIKVNDDYFENP